MTTIDHSHTEDIPVRTPKRAALASFMGSVFSLIDYNEYEDDMANAYYGCLSTTILDVMWRASMLDHFTGTGMGAEGIKETIIFYDMDRLDAPAIGAFV